MLYHLSQCDCAYAWLAAVQHVERQPCHEAYNVVVDIAQPFMPLGSTSEIVRRVDEFLGQYRKSIATIINMISHSPSICSSVIQTSNMSFIIKSCQG